MRLDAERALTTYQMYDARIFEGGTAEARLTAAQAYQAAVRRQYPGAYRLRVGTDSISVDMSEWGEEGFGEDIYATLRQHNVHMHD